MYVVLAHREFHIPPSHLPSLPESSSIRPQLHEPEETDNKRAMALVYNFYYLPQGPSSLSSSFVGKRKLQARPRSVTLDSLSKSVAALLSTSEAETQLKRCLRCRTLYHDKDNSPNVCSFHGHVTGEKGLFALAPPHQGIDGEWTDRSGVIVYKWNDKSNRPNTGSSNWKKRWSCCSEYDENAPPCRRGWHVSYDDGFTRY